MSKKRTIVIVFIVNLTILSLISLNIGQSYSIEANINPVSASGDPSSEPLNYNRYNCSFRNRSSILEKEKVNQECF